MKNKKLLAIEGHPTRGKEVIELLKMIGGKDTNNFNCSDSNKLYYLSNDCYICWDYIDPDLIDEFELFTLENFLEKYPFKVGNIVDRTLDYVSCIIDNMRWNSEKCCVEYHLKFLNGGECGWHVSECLFKPENEDVIIGTKVESTGFMQMGKTVSVIFNSENYDDEVELQLGDYEIEVRDNKTYAVKKKPKYPKTYEECCKVLDFCGDYFLTTYEPDCMVKKEVYGILQQVNSLTQLLICKSAYWKIAGKEMGLNKPWKPNYETLVDNEYFTIHTFNNEIVKSGTSHRNAILAFPTEEIRDIFYENFKDLIENCKELL